MQRKLWLDVFIVFATWFVILYIVSGFGFSGMEDVLAGIPLIWIVGWLAGASVGLALLYAAKSKANNLIHAPHAFASAQIMAKLQRGKKPPMLVDVKLPVPKRIPRGHSKKSSETVKKITDIYGLDPENGGHQKAIYAVAGVLLSKPGLKASAHGGHGQLTLMEHSINVVKAMRELAPQWEFTGFTDSRGRIVVSLNEAGSASHRFDVTDPMPMLAAFAHDIGKVECYELRDGQTIEVKPDHGTVGSRMLMRMPEIMDLPVPEREALILAVEFYHHIADMPTSTWVSDRARSLTALLYQADCLASVREGDESKEKAKAVQAYGIKMPKATQTGVTAPVLDPAANQDDPEEVVIPDEPVAMFAENEAEDEQGLTRLADDDLPFDTSAHAGQRNAHEAAQETGHAMSAMAAKSPALWTGPDGQSAMDVLKQLLRNKDVINGPSIAQRLGIKHRDWVYFVEPKVRMAASDLLDVRALREYQRGVVHEFSKEIMRQAQAANGLYDLRDGRSYTYKRAVFYATFGASGSEVAIYALSAKFLGLQHLQDAPRPPEILRPVFGDSSATNKAGAPSKKVSLSQQSLMDWILSSPDGIEVKEAMMHGHRCFLVPESVASLYFDFNSEDLAGVQSQSVPPLGRLYGEMSQEWFLFVQQGA